MATVAQQMRNTPAICRKSYIHPAIFEAFETSALGPPITVVARDHRGPCLTLQPGERAVLRVLERSARGSRAPVSNYPADSTLRVAVADRHCHANRPMGSIRRARHMPCSHIM